MAAAPRSRAALEVEQINARAVQCMEQGKLVRAMKALRRAEQRIAVTEHFASDAERIAVAAATFNNVACLCRQEGKCEDALLYLKKVLQMEQLSSSADIPTTHLNICAVLSQLGRHRQAVSHAEQARGV